MRLIGLDEAGYGPLLGPLVLGASVWQVDAADDLWTPLEACVARKATRGEWRLVVGDSKQVYKRGQGLGPLERSVRGLLQATGAPCGSVAELLTALGVEIDTSEAALPWYRGLDRTLPLAPQQAASDAVVQRLRTTMTQTGARCERMLAEVVCEPRYNSRVAQTRNKAALLLEYVLRLLARALCGVGDEDACVVVDRLGGRCRYREVLMAAYPQRALRVLEESPTRSAYELTAGGSHWRIEFTTNADAAHLPVALASMTAKYVREALMVGFNAYWRALAPELTPTAGYYADAQRFLGEIAPLLPQSRLATTQFVRSR